MKEEHELHAAPTRCLELLQTVSEKEWDMESRTTALGHSFSRPAERLQTEARHVFARKGIRRTPDTAVVPSHGSTKGKQKVAR